LENLTRRFPPFLDTGIAFAYSSYKDPNAFKGPRRFLRSFSLQLARQRDQLPEALMEFHGDHSQQGRNEPTFGGLETLLRDLIKGFKQVFIIFDALDECDLSDRRELMELFTRLITEPPQNGSNEYCRVKLFITSRREPDIVEAFESTPRTLEIAATKVQGDINAYVKSELSRRIEQGKLSLSDRTLEDKIRESLCRGGMSVVLYACPCHIH
jgi:hypothetical protein